MSSRQIRGVVMSEIRTTLQVVRKFGALLMPRCSRRTSMWSKGFKNDSTSMPLSALAR